MVLLNVYLNWFVIKRRLVQKFFCVLSTQKHLGFRLLVFQQWIPILQYTRFFTLQISIPMYIEIGISDRQRCIDICNVVSEIRKEIFLALLAFIRLQELITRAPFTESVKLKSWTSYSIWRSHQNLQRNRRSVHSKCRIMSTRWAIRVQTLWIISKFQPEARHKKFCSKKKSPELQQLPPTRDVLLCHLK